MRRKTHVERRLSPEKWNLTNLKNVANIEYSLSSFSLRLGPVSNLPSIISFSARDGVKIAARRCALNYLLQKRQGGLSRTKGRSRVSYRVERIEDSRKQSTTLYLLLRAYCSLLYRTQFRKVQFLWKNVPVEIFQIQRHRYKWVFRLPWY